MRWPRPAFWAPRPVTPALAAGAIEQLKAFSRATSRRAANSGSSWSSARASPAPAKGEFAFARPGRFRWDIRSPYQQLIVTDGKKLYFYDKDLKQVTIREAGDVISATPAAVLFGGADLDSAFALKDEGEQDGLQWVEALPKVADSGFDRIRVGMRDGLPARDGSARMRSARSTASRSPASAATPPFPTATSASRRRRAST